MSQHLMNLFHGHVNLIRRLVSILFLLKFAHPLPSHPIAANLHNLRVKVTLWHDKVRDDGALEIQWSLFPLTINRLAAGAV